MELTQTISETSAIGLLRQVFERLDVLVQIRRHGIRDFEPKIRLELEKGRFVIRTARDARDLEDCLRLRFEVFHREYMGRNRTHGVDLDEFDLRCDHLMIIDRELGRTIGTYRLNSSRFTTKFYSATEFDLAPLLALPGHKLEMGRACIDREHRNGAVMALLWRGIGTYVEMSGSDWLFGCTSIKTTSLSVTERIFQALKAQGAFSTEVPLLDALAGFNLPGFDRGLPPSHSDASDASIAEVSALIPALFRSSLKAGASVCSEPALDRDFGCIDFLTLLKMDEMSPVFARKYRS